MDSGKKANLKEKAAEEFRLFLLIAAYLAAFFVAFLTYRRLISREYGISSFHYGYALIEAIIIAKVILIGKAMGLGRKGVRLAVALRVMRSSLAYGALVAAFAVLEHVIEGLVHGKTLGASLEAFRDTGVYEILGRGLILFVAFIPFFAFWELGSLTGETKLFDYFFNKSGAQKAG
jgi:Na+-transporting NADH:ubiquinone oxidoreductase subunit NqrD